MISEALPCFNDIYYTVENLETQERQKSSPSYTYEVKYIDKHTCNNVMRGITRFFDYSRAQLFIRTIAETKIIV